MGLVAVLLGTFLPMTDFFIVNVALPTIDTDLHASPGMLQLVVAGYAIDYALLLVVGGRLGDGFGRRRLFMAGMAAFTLTSLACGLALTPGLLVGARVLQGVASAMMLPQVLSTIQATTAGDSRSRALGLYGATGGLAVVAGQLLGGLLVSANIAGLGWRPIFLVNVPVGVVGLVLAARFVPDTRSDAPAPVDKAGTVLLGGALLCLLVPLTEGRSLHCRRGPSSPWRCSRWPPPDSLSPSAAWNEPAVFPSFRHRCWRCRACVEVYWWGSRSSAGSAASCSSTPSPFRTAPGSGP